MKYLFLLCLLAFTLSCTRSDVMPSALVGTWRLISYCKPTGTSGCTPVTIPGDKNVFISFDAGNRFNEFYENTKPAEYAFLGCFGGNYQLEGANVRIRAGCMSSSMGQLIGIVSLSADRLVLNPFGTGNYTFVR